MGKACGRNREPDRHTANAERSSQNKARSINNWITIILYQISYNNHNYILAKKTV